jgi:hypothetical protein
MSPEEKSLLHETAELARENNKILKALRRGQVWSRWIRIFYWLVIIGLSIAGYYAIQPYVDDAKSVIGEIGEIKDGASENLQGFWNNLKQPK